MDKQKTCEHCGQMIPANMGRNGDEPVQGHNINGMIKSMNTKNEKTDFNRHHDNAIAAIMAAKKKKGLYQGG